MASSASYVSGCIHGIIPQSQILTCMQRLAWFCAAVCAPGFGGASASSCADCATASTPGYGPQQREDTQCIACPTQTAGYTFFYKGVRKAFTSPPVVRSAATSAADCVSKFAQIEDALWFLAGAATSRTANRITDCAAACGADCMFFTWEYTGATGDADAGTCLLALSADDATDKYVPVFACAQ